MTTRIDRLQGADNPRLRIGTTELLSAVADLGPNWPARFGHHEIAAVREAVDRELTAGTLTDGTTLSAQGQQLLPPRS